MQFAILFVIFFTTIIQSIFGVGVLLFGTPLMLLFGYDFQFSLTILLPISILINFFRLINKFNNIEFKFYRRLIIWTIPTIIFFLYYISASPINLNLIIGIFLIFISELWFNLAINKPLVSSLPDHTTWCYPAELKRVIIWETNWPVTEYRTSSVLPGWDTE